MSDPTKVYQGGIPGTFSTEMSNTAYSTSGENETITVPGKVDAPSPKISKDGGNGGEKTYDKMASQDFLLDSSYKTDMEVAARPTAMDIDNPDDISHADHCDDEDRVGKGY